jgi:hypothetical protein
LKKAITSFLVMVMGFSALSQHQELNEKAQMYKGAKTSEADTSSLLYAFKSGKVHGHFRYFFMSTQNASGLTDYYANAVGGGLRYETGKFRGFQMAVSGFYIFNIGSSDFTKSDPETGMYNRYESSLFDIEDPENKKDIDRLEELYLKYSHSNSSIIFGRQLINTPFVNLQDGRMRPTGVEGIWFDVNEIKDTKIEGGWLYDISPRGTVRWFNTGQSIGVYPAGVNPDGTKSGYKNNIESKGIAMLGVTTTFNKNLKLQLWDMFTENVFNTVMLQADYKKTLSNNAVWNAGLQMIRQDAIKDGGNINQSLTYFPRAQKSFAFGAKIGWLKNDVDLSLNYNRITSAGRYLVPREWGRDPFFTFMPRERNDGFGDVHAVMAKVGYTLPGKKINSSFSAGYFDLPDVQDFRLNKYGMPSYIQLNTDIRYRFSGFLKGMETQLLIAGKINKGNTYNNNKYVFNKVNMVSYNLVVNYYF